MVCVILTWEGFLNPLLVNPSVGWIVLSCRIINLDAISDELFGGLILCLQALVCLHLTAQGTQSVEAGLLIAMPSKIIGS